MKKVSNFVLFLALLLILPISANAEARFRVECDKTALARGESTTCTYKATKDAIDTAGVTQINAVVKTGNGLTIEGFTAGSLWTDKSTITSGSTQGNMVLESADTNGVSTTNFDLGTITVRLATDATECGAVCIEVSRYVMGGQTYTGNEECADFEIVGDTPTNPDTPQTGAFASYVVLVGGAALALATIAIVRSKNKFYRI